MRAYEKIESFVDSTEVQALRDTILGREELLARASGRRGLGPQYAVIDGDQIRAELPDLVGFGEARVRPAVERFAGGAVETFSSPRRAMRVQVYDRRTDGFRWHYDTPCFAALLALENTNQGETHVVSPELSRLLRLPLFALYPFPQLFSRVPHQTVRQRAGDLLILHGRRALHRAICQADAGRRIVLVWTYSERGRTLSPLRDRVARWMNY